jgi:hypothetical protein
VSSAFAFQTAQPKSLERRREQRKRWFRNGQKWRTGSEGRISVVKDGDTASTAAATKATAE